MVKVSVIMAAYNAEDFIIESINSILNQAHKNIELIVCDDASTDNTWQCIQSLVKKDKRIIPLRNERNLKAAATRNKCIKKATGNYIAIQDSDDISLPTRISKQVEFLKDNPKYDFVGTYMYSLRESGVTNIFKRPLYPKKEDFINGTPFCHGTVMFTKKCLLDVNGYYVSKYTERGQDADLLMRLYGKGYLGANISEPLYYYRLYKDSYKRRKIKTLLYSMLVRHRNYRKLKLLPKGYLYLLKMFLKGIETRFKKRV